MAFLPIPKNRKQNLLMIRGLANQVKNVNTEVSALI
jgi:hypothetical protein